MQQKAAVIQLSLLSFIHHCSICLSSSTSLGNLLKCLPSPHVLSLLRVSGKLHAMGTLVFPGLLSLINMVVCFFISEKTYNLARGRESGTVSSEFWYVYGLERQQIATHPATSHLFHPTWMLGMTAVLSSFGSRQYLWTVWLIIH